MTKLTLVKDGKIENNNLELHRITVSIMETIQYTRLAVLGTVMIDNKHASRWTEILESLNDITETCEIIADAHWVE